MRPRNVPRMYSGLRRADRGEIRRRTAFQTRYSFHERKESHARVTTFQISVSHLKLK